MRKLETAVCLGLIISIVLGNFSGFSSRIDKLQHEVLRLHILANSDTPNDQRLKLCVRDALLNESESLFSGCETSEQMKERAEQQSHRIQSIAETALQAQGCDDAVRVQLVKMYFEPKQYENLTMPAGDYTALRILIGKAQGHNWWCVMYPAICLPVAEPETYFDKETADILEQPERYEIKLKFLEYLQKSKKSTS